MTHRSAAAALTTTALLLSLSVLPVAGQSSAPTESTPPAASTGPSTPAESPAGSSITVEGYDYYFEGLPTSVPVGTSIGFTNAGAEVHMIAVARKNDDTSESWDELLALPEEEALAKVTQVGFLVAAPGGTAEGSFTLDQEGDYFAACFIPQGTTEMPPTGSPAPDASGDPAAPADTHPSGAPEGVPHFRLGMRQAFTVTAAGTEPGPLPSAMPGASQQPGASMGAESPAASTAP